MYLSSRETLLSIEREFLVLRVMETEKNDIFLQEKLQEFRSILCCICFSADQTKAKYDIISKK